MVRLHLQGESINVIAKQTGRTRVTITRWVRRFSESGSLHDIDRSGRPVTVTPKVRAKIKRLAQRKQRTSARAIHRTLLARGTDIGRESVRTALHDAGLHPHVRPRQPKQQHGDKKKRLTFAKEAKEVDWSRVWYADEKRFELFSRPNRKNDVRWTDDVSEVEAVEVRKHVGAVNVWGAFSRGAKAPLNLFTGVMTAQKYTEILDSTLLPATRACHGDGAWAYLQDNDPKHTAAHTRRWLEQHVPTALAASGFPPRSPDLNPMEHAWAKVADHVARAEPQTVDALRRAVRAAWEVVMTDDYRHSLSDSMPTRLRAVRKERGHHTH